MAEEFFWFNPSKLPSPIEWVNKRKIRAKDAVNTIWWLSKSDFPKANVSRVLVPYSARMKKLLKNRDKYYTPKKRRHGSKSLKDCFTNYIFHIPEFGIRNSGFGIRGSGFETKGFSTFGVRGTLNYRPLVFQG